MRDGQLLVVDVASIPQPALMNRAREVAGALDLEVYICCVRDEAGLPPPLPGKKERVQKIREKLEARCRHALDNVIERMRADGIDADGSVTRASSATTTMLQHVRQEPVACVMIARRPHTRFEQVTLSGDDFAIIRECPVPVWVVNRSKGSGDRIVAAVGRPHSGPDEDSLDDRILDEVSTLAEKLGKEGHAVHAFGDAGMVSPPIEPAAEDPDDNLGTSRNDERIRKILSFVEAHGVAPEHTHIREGKIERVLEEESKPMNADLLVLGARTRGRLRRMISGGTAERLIENAAADVLILKKRKARVPDRV